MGGLYEFEIASREQLVSLGLSGARGFSYLQEKKLDQYRSSAPQMKVTDINGISLDQESYTELPKSKEIVVTAGFDGKVVLKQRGKILCIRQLIPNQDTRIDGIFYDTEVNIFQGCDCVRRICFEKVDINTRDVDSTLVRKLNTMRGNIVTVSHSVGILGKKLNKYPLTRQWVYNAIRKRTMPRAAYQLLVSLVNGNHQEGLK